MIDAYVAASRKSRPPSPPMRAVYGAYYEGLRSLLDDASGLPDLHVTYTIERRCEHVKLGAHAFILYDQHLGQSFNKLNRILVARHDGERLAMHYACKVLAERLSTLGALKLGLLAGLLSQTFEMRSREKGDPFDFDAANQTLRLNLVAVQEIFVLAHELAHVIHPRNEAVHDKAIRDRVDDFCGRRDAGEGDDGHYGKILRGREAEYLPELFADDFGARIAVQLARRVYGVPLSHCRLGVVLAFKYTRLFRHLEIIARSLAELEDESDAEVIAQAFKRTGDLMWDPEEGRIFFYQLREHLVRDTLTELPRSWGLSDDAGVAGDIHVSEFVDEYDQRIEFPILFDLMDRLKAALIGGAQQGLAEMAADPKRAIANIDELTGWSFPGPA